VLPRGHRPRCGEGLSGFHFNGLIIILSLLGHKWNQARYR
jgi:hypothetical protein